MEKKQETNGITVSSFFVWQFMVHSMICMSSQPGKPQNNISTGLLFLGSYNIFDIKFGLILLFAR